MLRNKKQRIVTGAVTRRAILLQKLGPKRSEQETCVACLEFWKVVKSDSNTWTFSAQDVRSAGVWAAETILRSRTLGEKATRVTPSQVAQKIGKARESVARSLSGFDEVSKAIHWAQHQLERSGYYHVKFQQKHPPKEMAAAGHKVQIERLRKGYWDYSSRLLP